MLKILNKAQYDKIKEKNLYGRYITNAHIQPILEAHKSRISLNEIGKSVAGRPIYGFNFGSGKRRVLMWSQMHGNESTTTKAIFDLLNYVFKDSNIIDSFNLYIIPILNPDGAEAYTRVNANQVDLNRDAQNLSQPESVILRRVFNDFEPDFCFNLHGQRTIFSAGNNPVPATLSFLAPSQDEERSISSNRLIAMDVIGQIFKSLDNELPNGIGLYDDSFNLNCVGDTFQSLKVPTLLFEAGHYPGDYQRESTRYFVFNSLVAALNAIEMQNTKPTASIYKSIPINQKLFLDVIIRNVKLDLNKPEVIDVGVQFKEVLVASEISFKPIVHEIGDLKSFYGHKEFDANSKTILHEGKNKISMGSEIDFVLIKNEKILIKT